MRQFPPRRIVCLTEETVETLYLLGEQDRIVGVSGYAVRPPQVRREKPRVSAFISADIPKILALEPLHGWAITLRLKSISGGVLQVSEGSLYPALHKLEQEGWITAEWKQTENNRRAKFYSLTRLGRKQLESEAANWQRLSAAISHVIQLSEV